MSLGSSLLLHAAFLFPGAVLLLSFGAIPAAAGSDFLQSSVLIAAAYLVGFAVYGGSYYLAARIGRGVRVDKALRMLLEIAQKQLSSKRPA
jgi:membrane protein DedA with SNARE-associated domain